MSRNKDAVALAERAVQLNTKLLARLQEAESIIRGLTEILDRDNKRWQELCAGVGGEAEFLRLRDEARLHVARQRAMAQVNSRKAVDQGLRTNVEIRNELLLDELPVAAKRFARIANELDMKPDQVRYIIDGPRRKKKK